MSLLRVVTLDAFLADMLAAMGAPPVAMRPDDVVVMGNLSSHKGPRVRVMIEAAGRRAVASVKMV